MEAQPFEICHNTTLGRHLVASQPIESGAIIIKESPLVRGPFLHTVPVCLSCGKILDTNNSQSCSKCGWPVCNDTCAKSPNHLPECTLTEARGSKITIKNFGIPNPNYQFVTILRTLFLKRSSPETWKKLMQLQSNPIEGNVAPPCFIAKLFKLNDWSEEEIGKVSGILTVNGHELPLTAPHQLVVYDTTSLLEHNCRANCTKTFTDNGEVLVVTSEPIQKGDHLSICYTDPFWGTQNRRHHLHQTKQFWCSCSRCEDPSELGTHLNSVKCPNRPCDGCLLPKSFLIQVVAWICDKCDAVFSNDDISTLLAKVGMELSQMPKGNALACKQFVKKYEKILTPNHFYLVDAKMALCHMLASQNFESLSGSDLMLLLKMTEELKIVAETVAPAETRFRGLVLYKFAKTKIEIARREEDENKFRFALMRAKKTLSDARSLLANEPSLLHEGRVYLQIGLELKLIDDLLNNK